MNPVCGEFFTVLFSESFQNIFDIWIEQAIPAEQVFLSFPF